MRHDGDHERTDAGVERALASATRPRADPAFRARLREQFLDVEAARAPAPKMRPVRERTNVFPLVWPAVLAASVALVIVFVLSRDAVVRWHVLAGEGQYVVDSYVVDGSDPKRLLDLLQTAKEIETGDKGLRVKLLDQLVIDLGPHTHVSQMRFPPAGMYTMHADAGSIRVGTGPGYPGGLVITTDDMKAKVVGTFLAIDMLPPGTCLCCLHGKVMCDIRDKTGEHPVGDGKRGFAFHDGKPGLWDPAVEPHLEPLRALQAEIERLGWGR